MTEEDNCTAAPVSQDAAQISGGQEEEESASRLVKKIGNTTFLVDIHFSETSQETMEDKLLRLIRNDICSACQD